MALAIPPALPVRSNAAPPLPFKVTAPYARLLASDPDATGLEHEGACAMYNMVRFMHALIEQGTPYTDEYRKLYDLFSFASDARGTQQTAKELTEMVLPFPFMPLLGHASVKRLARRTLKRVEEQGTALVPCFSRRHAMYLQIDREPQGYTLRIYNTGDGIETPEGVPRHAHRGGNKWQSMYVVRKVRAGDGPGCLNVQQLCTLLCTPLGKFHGPETVDDIYAWANALGEPYNPPRYAMQAIQKSGSCTHKSILAVARNLLSDVAYCELVARLREQAYANYMSRRHRSLHQPLIDLFARRAVSARAKAENAKLQAGLRAQHAQDRWMVESTDREAMDRALTTARGERGRAFLLSYRDDTHRLALSTIDRSGLRHTALLPREGALVTPEATYPNLLAVARHWQRRGYAQIGRAQVQAAASPLH